MPVRPKTHNEKMIALGLRHKRKPFEGCIAPLDTRPTASQRGYDSEWKRISEDYRKRHQWCEAGCGRRSALVDHIIPRVAGGTNNESNLQALCRSCHTSKTYADKRKYPEAYRKK